jgi:hypothetical protein
MRLIMPCARFEKEKPNRVRRKYVDKYPMNCPVCHILNARWKMRVEAYWFQRVDTQDLSSSLEPDMKHQILQLVRTWHKMIGLQDRIGHNGSYRTHLREWLVKFKFFHHQPVARDLGEEVRQEILDNLISRIGSLHCLYILHPPRKIFRRIW